VNRTRELKRGINMTAKRTEGMVTGVFRSKADADRAYDALLRRGYTDSQINVLMSDQTRTSYYPSATTTGTSGRGDKHEAGTLAVEGMGVGGAIGTAVGASLAAIAAVGTTLMVPGLGIVIAGPIAAALAGGGAGAVTGGLIGLLTGAGFTEENAEAYHAALREGGVVLGVTPRNSNDASEIEKEFRNCNGENVCRC
jgi:hypothetical protein